MHSPEQLEVPRRISQDDAEKLIQNAGRDNISEWNSHLSSGRTPEAWLPGGSEENRGLTVVHESPGKKNLANLQLVDMDFGNTLTLSNCQVTEGHFERVLASSINLRGCQFLNCRFKTLKWHSATLSSCRFIGCIFEDCDFASSNLSHSVIESEVAPISSSRLVRCTLDYASIQSALISNTSIAKGSYRMLITNTETLFDVDLQDDLTPFDGAEAWHARMSTQTQKAILLSLRRNYWDSQLNARHKNWASKLFWRLLWSLFNYDLRLSRQAVAGASMVSIYASLASMMANTGSFPKLEGGSSLWVLAKSYYFVIATMTTLGYGDIVPSTDSVLALTLSVVSTLTGVILFGTLVARLVSIMTWPK